MKTHSVAAVGDDLSLMQVEAAVVRAIIDIIFCVIISFLFCLRQH